MRTVGRWIKIPRRERLRERDAAVRVIDFRIVALARSALDVVEDRVAIEHAEVDREGFRVARCAAG